MHNLKLFLYLLLTADNIPMETSTPDNVLGVATNITVCEDLDTLQIEACSHDFGVCVCVCVRVCICVCASI